MALCLRMCIIISMNNNVSTHTSFSNNTQIGTNIRPEFIRLPKSGSRDPWTGLSRSALNSLILPTNENNKTPLVKSSSLRAPGAVRGTRLIHLGSLLEYLHRKLEVQNGPASNKDLEKKTRSSAEKPKKSGLDSLKIPPYVSLKTCQTSKNMS